MTLEAVLEAYAGFERRALLFYRRLAERFGDQARASQHWRQMADAEASHFTLLRLAPDWIQMEEGPKSDPGLDTAALDAFSARLGQLEAAAERPGLTLAEAVELTLAWEELELPRILDLLRCLPERARSQVRAGIIGEAGKHYADLMELAQAGGGAAGLVERVEALRTRAAAG